MSKLGRVIREMIKGDFYLNVKIFRYLVKGKLSSPFTKIILWNEKKYRKDIKEFKYVNIQENISLFQYTHPDAILINIDNVEKIVLVVTGYPYGDEKYENPAIYYSEDTINFAPLAKNPLVMPQKGYLRNHLSDVDIISFKNQYFLFYRECIYSSTSNFSVIHYLISDDCINWKYGEVADKGEINAFLSPAVSVHGKSLVMYYVDFKQENSIFRRKISNDFCFKEKHCEDVRIENQPNNKQLWHFDIVIEDKIYHGLFTFCEKKGGSNCSLYYGRSYDEGKTWIIGQEIKIDTLKKYFKMLYRASIVKYKDGWKLYISIKTNDDSWYIYVIDSFNPENYINN